MSKLKCMDRVQLGTLVGFAVVGGLATSVLGYFVATQKQRAVRQQVYVRRALDCLDVNKRACQLIGKPITVHYVDLSREDVFFQKNKVQVFVPLKGERLQGNLHVKAHRSPVDDSWILEKLTFVADTGYPEEWIGKTFVIYKGDPEPVDHGIAAVAEVRSGEAFNPDTHPTPQ